MKGGKPSCMVLQERRVIAPTLGSAKGRLLPWVYNQERNRGASSTSLPFADRSWGLKIPTLVEIIITEVLE